MFMSEEKDSQIFIVRVTSGREAQFINRFHARLLKENEGILAILKPHLIKGYVFVEAVSRDAVIQAIYGLKHAKGVIENPIAFDDILHFFEASAKKLVINRNDIVELVSGPYKGEKAQVKRVDKTKEKVVVELLEATVPIPITVSLDSVRVIDRKGGGQSDE